jgi:O-antigen biosynthesis alpha-1,2-mannosyltransferase
MATIGIDATYTADPRPSGMGLFAKRFIEGLAKVSSPHHYLLCYRPSRFRQRRHFLKPRPRPGQSTPVFSTSYYQEPFTFWLPWRTDVFHSLAQRPPAFRFRREVVTVNDVFPITGEDYSTSEFREKFSRLLREAVARAARVIVPSEYSARRVADHTGTPRDIIRVVPYAAEVPARLLSEEERRAARARWVGEDGIMILHVGVLQNRKNLLNALRALLLLPPHYRLVLAGGDGYGAKSIHDMIHTCHLEARVTRLGYVPDDQLTLLYQAATVFLFPSWEEGFGIPVLEAMAHGTPVVASRASSLPEAGGGAAVYVDPADPQDIARALTQVVDGPELRATMVERGFERVRAYTWHDMAAATVQIYEEVLSL